MKNITTLLCFFSLLTFTSCEWIGRWLSGKKDESVRLVRYDRAVDDFVRTGNFTSRQVLTVDFLQQTQILIEEVLHLGRVEDERVLDSLRLLYADSTLCMLRGDVARQFRNVESIEKTLTAAFNKLAEEVPEIQRPMIYTQVSALKESVIVKDSLIGISLDKYLGADYPLYAGIFTPCQREQMKASRIPLDCITYYLASVYPPEYLHNKTLLDRMLRLAKFNWTATRLLNISIWEALDVCSNTQCWYLGNERRAWELLTEGGLLQTTDNRVCTSFVGYNALEPYFKVEESRGIGLWMGMNIINSYMHRHPDVTIAELLANCDYETILRDSGYHPQ